MQRHDVSTNSKPKTTAPSNGKVNMLPYQIPVTKKTPLYVPPHRIVQSIHRLPFTALTAVHNHFEEQMVNRIQREKQDYIFDKNQHNAQHHKNNVVHFRERRPWHQVSQVTNFVKSVIYQEHKHTGLIMDLGCNIGQDIQKWRRLHEKASKYSFPHLHSKRSS